MNCKLDHRQIELLARLRAGKKVTTKLLAAALHVHPSTVQRVWGRKTWTRLTKEILGDVRLERIEAAADRLRQKLLFAENVQIPGPELIHVCSYGNPLPEPFCGEAAACGESQVAACGDSASP